jgi:hypothetical protein
LIVYDSMHCIHVLETIIVQKYRIIMQKYAKLAFF